MPRGNVDEDLPSPKGQLIGGNAIGILCLDMLWMPYPPGCVNNASTFNFPVLYKVVEGYSSTKRGEGGEFYPPCLLDVKAGNAALCQIVW